MIVARHALVPAILLEGQVGLVCVLKLGTWHLASQDLKVTAQNHTVEQTMPVRTGQVAARLRAARAQTTRKTIQKNADDLFKQLHKQMHVYIHLYTRHMTQLFTSNR